MAAGVYLDDRTIFNNAIRQFCGGNLCEGVCLSMGALPNYIYPTGESQESSRDQIHARMGLSGLVLQAKIAFNQGIDLFAFQDSRLLLGASYNAKYQLGHPVDSQTFISDQSRGRVDECSQFYEIMADHYRADEALRKLFNRAAKQTLRAPNNLRSDQQTLPHWQGMLFNQRVNQEGIL